MYWSTFDQPYGVGVGVPGPRLCHPALFGQFHHYQSLLNCPDRTRIAATMTAASKRQKRQDYRRIHKEEGNAELPRKRFYRQRAHANPFSDHQLT